MSAAYLAVHIDSDAQVIYMDADPDISVLADEYFLDMDGNGSADFKLVFESEFFATFAPPQLKLRLNPLGSNMAAYVTQVVPVTYSGTPWYTYVGGATQLLFTNVPALGSDVWIDEGLAFQSDIGAFYERLFFYIYSESNYQAFSGGEWNGVTDMFAGVRLFSDGAYHYGWLRLNIDEATGILLKDYAFESNPETPIQTRVRDYSIQWIDVQDNGISGTGADLAFTFEAAGNEEDIASYRVICAKSGALDAITVETATALPPENYREIIPTGAMSYSEVFTAFSNDADGDPITTGVEYRLLILNVMEATTGYANILSNRSNVVLLQDTVNTVLEPGQSDIANAGNASDIQVSFDEPLNNNGILEYRIVLAQRDSAMDVTLSDVLALPAAQYIALTPGAITYSVIPAADFPDINGNPVMPEKYKVAVLSIPDGISANVANWTGFIAPVTLETTTVSPVPILADINETASGADLQLTFETIFPEQTVASYQVYFVDFAAAFDFDLDAALASPYFTELTPTGADVLWIGDNTTRDSDGDSITWGVPYYAYVLSLASEFGLEDTLSVPSNQLILNYPVTISATGAISVPDAWLLMQGGAAWVNCGETSAHVSFVDMSGRVVFAQSLGPGRHFLETGLPSGVYIARLWSVAGSVQQTVQILRD